MPLTKAILGHVEIETALRKRACAKHRKGKAAHDIVKGEQCLVVAYSDGAKVNYCLDAAAAILDKAAVDLAALRSKAGL